jgi:hypothetical protein
MACNGERKALIMPDAPKTPKIEDTIPILVDGFSPQLLIAALVLGLVLGALVIVMLPDRIVEDGTDA